MKEQEELASTVCILLVSEPRLSGLGRAREKVGRSATLPIRS